MPYVIAEPCIDCIDGACLRVCPADCIYEGERMFYIDPDHCVSCGACEWACPVEAIYHEDDLPAHWRHFGALNAEFARTVQDTPTVCGGAERIGFDHVRLGATLVASTEGR